MDKKPSISFEAAIGRVIEILNGARKHPEMYFDPIAPPPAIDFIHGLRVGLSVFGLQWNGDSRQAIVESRDLEFKADWEDKQLQERGYSPTEIVDQLLSIEIEMWERQCGLGRPVPHG